MGDKWLAMKLLSKVFAAALLLAGQGEGFSQGFVNLNFESAVIKLDSSSPYYPHAVIASNAIPGWNAYGFPNGIPAVATWLGYDTIALDLTLVSVETITNPFPQAIQGKYSIFLQGGNQYSTYTNGVGIGQTAQFPHNQFIIGVVNLRFPSTANLWPSTPSATPPITRSGRRMFPAWPVKLVNFCSQPLGCIM